MSEGYKRKKYSTIFELNKPFLCAKRNIPRYSKKFIIPTQYKLSIKGIGNSAKNKELKKTLSKIPQRISSNSNARIC